MALISHLLMSFLSDMQLAAVNYSLVAHMVSLLLLY